MQTINCNGQSVDLSHPHVMGIINVTPDSFYDGGKTTHVEQILAQAGQMIAEGATFLDVGGYSSRPGADDVSISEELDRVLPAIEAILQQHPEALISVDTFRAEVARQAVETGACMVNDISGGTLDEAMLDAVASLQVPYILMHMKGSPQTMTQKTQYTDIVAEVMEYLEERTRMARQAGIEQVIVDPGFGFAKTRAQNFELLGQLDQLSALETPLLVGISRKSMIYKTLGITPEQALNGTTALHMIALEQGAQLLRVHDVAPAMECVQLWKELAEKS